MVIQEEDVNEAARPPSLSDDEFSLMYWAKERERCERDFRYFCKAYLKIKGREEMGLLAFVLNPLQEELFTRVCDQKRRLGYVRMVIGKQRQVGVSLFFQALGFWLTAFHNNRNGMVMAHDDPTALSLYGMYHTFYNGLPAPLRPDVETMTRKRTVFPHRKSTMFVGHAMNPNVGVSHTIHFLHISEAARFTHTDFIQSSLFPALSSAKDYEDTWDCSIAVVESASDWPGHWFKAFGDAARNGNGDWELFYAPYYLTKEFEAPVSDDFHPTAQESQLLDQFHGMLRPHHITWRRNKMREYADDLSAFFRQYGISWDESWTLPTGTHRVFPFAALEAMQRHITRGTMMHPQNGQLVPMTSGALEVWKMPESGVKYDIGFDVSKGEAGLDPEKADFSVLEVICRDTREQVAEARGKWDPSGSFVADLVYDTGMAYNVAQINPDTTSGWGHIVLTSLQRRGYVNIYCRRNRVTTDSDNVTAMAGLAFTKSSKSTLVMTAVSMAYDGVRDQMPLIVHSGVLFHEILNFLSVGDNLWASAPGYKDDCVTAWMLALLSAYDETVMVEAVTAHPPGQPRRDPATSINIAAILHQRDYRDMGRRRKWR